MSVAPSDVSMSEYNEETLFSMSQPLATSATTDNLLLSTPAPSQHDTRGSSSSMGAAIGATVAVVGGIIFLFLLYKYCKRSKPNSSDVELGYVSSTRSRQRQGPGRSVPISEAESIDPVALANARSWQDSKGLQGYGYEPRGTARPAGKTSSNIFPSALAQARGWDRPFGADGFQVSRTYGGDVGPSSPVQFPTHVPPRKPVPVARPVGKQRCDTQQTGRNISPISPQTEDEARHHGPSDYSYVSPLA